MGSIPQKTKQLNIYIYIYMGSIQFLGIDPIKNGSNPID